jgi:hypothetical protein
MEGQGHKAGRRDVLTDERRTLHGDNEGKDYGKKHGMKKDVKEERQMKRREGTQEVNK